MGIEDWVNDARDTDRLEFRQAVHTILLAIAESKLQMIMKGGLLMAIQHRSPRFTADIDFSTDQSPTKKEIETDLNHSLRLAVELLDYDLDCRLHSCKRFPPNTQSRFGSFKIKVGHAYKGTRKHQYLQRKASPDVVEIDYSLNEPISNVEPLIVAPNATILTYAVEDLIAEKFRALLQQEQRKRFRRQDVFDLHFLLSQNELSEQQKQIVFDSLQRKAKARQITPRRDSLDNSEVRRRAKAEYHSLADDVAGELPDFDMAYDLINGFYKSLPFEA